MAAELIQLEEGVSYVSGRVNCGVVLSGEKACVCVIDTGIDPDFGRRIFSILSSKGLKISSILNTHAHSDHFSGNSAIVERSGARVYAPKTEAATLEFPELESYSLWGMAKPPKESKNKYLMGEKSPVDGTIEKEGPFSPDNGFSIEAISLPGHSPNQMGFISKKILFAGDSIFSGNTLAKHKLLFCSDISKAIESLEKISALAKSGEISTVVPSHGKILKGDEILKVAEENRKGLLDASETIYRLVKENTAEEILKEYADSQGLHLDFVQYFLHLTIFKAHLTYLEEAGRAECFVNENRLVWRKKS